MGADCHGPEGPRNDTEKGKCRREGVIPRERSDREDPFLMHSEGDTDCHDQSADWSRNDTDGSGVRIDTENPSKPPLKGRHGGAEGYEI